MNKLFVLALSILSGCSVIGSLFIGEKCDQPDQSLISCREVDDPNRDGDSLLAIAEVCSGGFKVLQPCELDEFCITDPANARGGIAGCGFPSSCGNGVIDVINSDDPNNPTSEECDDGNNIDTDGCQSCKINFCGDGIINFSDGDNDGKSDETCEPKGVGDCNNQCQFGCIDADDCREQLSPEEQGCFAAIECTAGACETTPVIDQDGNDCTQQVCVVDVGLVVLQPDNIACSLPGGDSGVCLNGTCIETNTCGDGVIQTNNGEQCDDDNDDDNDACRNDCTVNCEQDPNNAICGCGNGIIEAPEACDDANNINGDGCDDNCTITSCGNGRLSAPEICDDGNQINADGCDNNCTLPSCGNGVASVDENAQPEQCDDGNQIDGDFCDNNCTVTACGNGVVTGVEACDDGDLQSGDECDADCSIPVCGNGITANNAPLSAGGQAESCDDGNNDNDDGCDSNCTIPRCGNGILAGDEVCDDGNTDNNDSCDANCTVPACGNSIIADDGTGSSEECDDGNQNPNDGCDENCRIEVCGDNIRQSNEACDDGGTAPNDGCSATCQIERCGDGTVQTDPNRPEDCEDNNLLNNDGCSNTCRFETCGDGTLQRDPNRPEACEDGNLNNGDGCNNLCQIERCGNGVEDAGESCDDGCTTGIGALCEAIDNGDGCSSNCQLEVCGDGIRNDLPTESCDGSDLGGITSCTQLNLGVGAVSCDPTCLFNTSQCSQSATCGDDIRQGNEQCDDGNGISNDGCSNCLIERCGDSITQTDPNRPEQCDDGNLINTDNCTNLCTLPRCGDGSPQASNNEQCDDGNLINTDFCNNDCTLPRCGDRIVGNSANEECDDGNTNNTDDCTNACESARCGDGIIQAVLGEECDDSCGNNGCFDNDNGDGCDSACRLEFCGDGAVNRDGLTGPFDECDDGNPADGDGCNADCEFEACGDGILNNANDRNGDGDTIDAGEFEECDDGGANGSTTCSILCARCGNGIISGDELCDQGDVRGFTCDDLGLGNGTLSCNSTCDDFNITQCVIQPVCGDGTITFPEDCDDSCGGNGCTSADNNDGCSSTCEDESCGDGIINRNGVGGQLDQCDDGNLNNNDGCSASCRIEFCGDDIINRDGPSGPLDQCDDGAANNNSGSCTLQCRNASCGDGLLRSIGNIEACDDGNVVSGDGCNGACQIERCGNGVEDVGEECDDGPANNNNDICTNACEDAVCGDGIIRFGVEECDDANTNPNDSCDNCQNTCGNNVINPGEACDDGDNNNGDGCDAFCELEAFCGNFITDPGEDCDDGCALGNPALCDLADNGDGCNEDCEVEFCGDGSDNDGTQEECDDGDNNNNDFCTNACELNVCGDGITFNDGGSETCDDGCNLGDPNLCEIADNGDGCSQSCQTEIATCGNGITEFGEQCDDLTIGNNDACPNGFNGTCEPAVCGDGFIFSLDGGTEQCDDGNVTPGDGCDNNCFFENPICGNGSQEPGETCDDGNNNNSDFCPDGPGGTCDPATCGDGFIFTGTEDCDPPGPGCNANCDFANINPACPPTFNVSIPDGVGLSTSGNTANGTNTEGGSCSPGSASATEDAYRVELATPLSPGQSLQISVTNQSSDTLVLYARRNLCDDETSPNELDCLLISSSGTLVIPEIDISGDTEIFVFVDTDTGLGGQYNIDFFIFGGPPPPNICGNSTLEGTEQCDDGNNLNGDGCSEFCFIEGECIIEPSIPFPGGTLFNAGPTSLPSNSNGLPQCTIAQDGGELIFRVPIFGSSNTVDVTLTPDDPNKDMSVALKLIDCNSPGFAICRDVISANPNGESIVGFPVPEGNLYIFVDSKSPAGQGTFTLTVFINP